MPRIQWTTTQPPAAAGALLVVPVTSAELETPVSDEVRSLAEALTAARFRGKVGDAFSFTTPIDANAGGLHRVILLGVGSGLTSASDIRKFAVAASRRADELGVTHCVVRLPAHVFTDDAPSRSALGRLAAEGLTLGLYRYERYKSADERRPQRLEQITFVSDDTAAADGTRRGEIVASAIAMARDLANGPADLVTPNHLASVAQDMVQRLSASDVFVEVLDRSACEALGMGLYLAVARGSDEPSRFIHLRYRPPGKPAARVCLVGKGVTFDSGGYSLKPTDGMLDMKMDMAGAAAVLASFEALVQLAVPYEVHVLVAATENMISGKAYRLGDVFTASNGTTVEINNTDAEGRLTLADALVYADRLEPDIILDFATLTGACMVALGPYLAGVMTPDDALAEGWLAAAARSGEDMWRLPLPSNLMEQLDSTVADLRNTGERWGGALTAGLFLSKFTGERRWMHVDIAGPAMAAKPGPVTTAGGTGFPVATIVEFLSGDLP